MGTRTHAAAFLVALSLAGCDAAELECRIDVECGGVGVCVSGRCVPTQAQLDAGGGAGSDAGANDLAQPGAPDGFVADGFAAACPFNGDGVIQRAELPAMAGLGGFFMTPPADATTTVDLVKHAGVWDFSAAVPGDQKVFDGLTAPAGQWWAASFPDASYAQLFDAGTGTLGVYRIDDTHLWLLGVVSPTDGFTRTELSYDPPVDVLRFPLAKDQAWSVTSTVSGLYSGVGFFASQTWGFSVDADGKVKTPAASFDALRLRIDYEQVYGLSVVRHLSYLFVTECYGTIARVRSTTGETRADFSEAAVYRRLAAP